MSAAPTAAQFVAELQREFPRFRIVYKRDSLFSKAIDLVLRVLTFGVQHEFMTRYHTVIGNTLYVPSAWDGTPDLSKVITLRHERVHLRQRRRYGDVGMTLRYLLPFFPLGLAYGRARIEWEAYTETLRATAELRGLDAARSPALKRYIVAQFTSGAYGWMWPFPRVVGRWVDEVVQQLEREATRSPRSTQAAPDPA